MCDCLMRADEKLRADHNTEIIFNLLPPYQAYVATQISEKKRGARAVMLVASFCPFCGEKYPESKADG